MTHRIKRRDSGDRARKEGQFLLFFLLGTRTWSPRERGVDEKGGLERGSLAMGGGFLILRNDCLR